MYFFIPNLVLKWRFCCPFLLALVSSLFVINVVVALNEHNYYLVTKYGRGQREGGG